MAIPEKYSHIDFTPPSGARREAEYGLKLRREYGRGGTAVGIARARDLANGKKLSPSTLRRMKAFFDRHQSDEKADGFNRGDKNWPSNGKIANLLWGGPSGYAWARKVVEQMNAADAKEGRDLRPYGSSHGIKPSVYVVHGPPGSPRADYVAENMGDNDVVFDFAKIMSALSGGGRNENLVAYCTDIRTIILKRALGKPKVDRTWIITTEVGDELSRQLSDIPTKYVKVDATKEECLQRIKGTPDEEELRTVIEKYFDDSPEERRAPEIPGVERRFLGNFSHVEKPDPELLRVEQRADPQTGKRQTYVVGYAARFHKDSLLLGDFVERIAPEAFDIVEKRMDADGKPLQTRCLFNHSPDQLLGRFPTTMRLVVDDKGLKYECLLPESRQDLAELIQRGDLTGSSFSFVVDPDGGEKWTTENGRSIRTVTKIKSLLDCGPVTYPAYGDSTVAVAKRSYEQFVSEKSGHVESRDAVKSAAAEQIEKTRKFLLERRDCGTGAGGFKEGNTCGGKGGAANKEESAWREGAGAGALLGAGFGSLAGPPGTVAGAAIGAVAGATIGLFGMQSKKPLEDAYKATGTSLSKADKAAKILDKQMTVSADSGSLVMEGDGLTVRVNPPDESAGVPKTAVVTVARGAASKDKGGDKLPSSIASAAQRLGAKSVAVQIDKNDEDAVKSFRESGYSPSSSDGSTVMLTKRVSGKKASRSHSPASQVARETLEFLRKRKK